MKGVAAGEVVDVQVDEVEDVEVVNVQMEWVEEDMEVVVV